MREIALLGATASGKTNLAMSLAKKFKSVILSLDSLSVYKEIDIASAKPTPKEMSEVKHFGINIIRADEVFNVTLFFDLYKQAKKFAKETNSSLIIVGGTSFYLKAMLSGLSDKPFISEENSAKVARYLQDIPEVYKIIQNIDSKYAKTITKNDKYRMEKWLEIYFETGEVPSQFFAKTLKEPLIKSIPIYELLVDKEILRQKITLRTENMIKIGLIAEIVELEKKYGREPRCMKAIGIKEVLAYLDGLYSLEEMREKIITNTARLAKRQRTFNKTQFAHPIIQGTHEELLERVEF